MPRIKGGNFDSQKLKKVRPAKVRFKDERNLVVLLFQSGIFASSPKELAQRRCNHTEIQAEVSSVETLT
jgi:hypothetical protein